MSRNRSGLSWQVLRSVLSVYFAITLLVTLIQVGVEYLHTRNMIRSELVSIERTFYPALATALWELNTAQLEAIQRGILDLPTISAMRVVDPEGQLMTSAIGDSMADTAISHQFRVSYRFSGEDIHLAWVTFLATDDVIIERLKVGYQMILVSAVIKSIALTLLFLWVFHRQLGQPLEKLAKAVDAVDLDNLPRNRIDFQQSRENELTHLESAFNRMLVRLDEERKAHDATRDSLNKGLENLVAKRTEELQEANDQLEVLVRTDPLTGVANRRFFVEKLRQEMQRANRSGMPLSLLMIDLDQFKQINDSWGHAAGDEVLRNFAITVAAPLRTSDLLARIGGEEFSILLPDTHMQGAVEVANRILESVREQTITYGGQRIGYSVSIGAAQLRPGEDDCDQLLKRADDALYRAKEAGRNQIQSMRTFEAL